MNYHGRMAMKGITIKLSEETLKRLEQEARATGRSVAAIIRERVEAKAVAADSVYALTHDLAGGLAGSHKSATNDRRKFKRP
jgi:predicted DNA-binding protein